MNFSISTVDQAIIQAVKGTYCAQLAQRKADLMRRVEAFVSTIRKVSNKDENDLSSFAAYKKEIESLIQNIPLHDEQSFLETEYQSLISAMDELIAGWPTQVEEVQAKERYYKQQGDNIITSTGKTVKRSLFLISKLPRKTANGVRKRLGKAMKDIQYAKHKVPLKAFAEIYLKEALIRELLGQSYAWMRLEARIYDLLFEMEDAYTAEVDFTISEDKVAEMQLVIDEQYDATSKGVDTCVTKVINQFKQNYAKAGTFELKSAKLTPAKATIVIAENRTTLKSLANGWQRTHQTMLEDWRLNAQLRRMSALVRQEYVTLEKRIAEKKATITIGFAEIDNYLTEAKKRAAKDSPVGELKKLLVKEKYEASKSLNNQLLKNTVEALINQNFAALVNRLDTKTNELCQLLPDKTAILKSGAYDVPVKSSDLQFFSPQELFAFEYMPGFTKATEKLRQLVTREIDALIAATDDLDDIVTFCLDSAMASLDQDNADPSESLMVYQEGLDRALNKLREDEKQLDQLTETILAESLQAVDYLVASIIELTSNENARELNMRINKGKALRSKEHYLDRLRQASSKAGRQLTVSSLRLGRIFSKVTNSLQSSLSVPAGEQKVSSEVSDFLAESFSRINDLPIVYQRLYKISALTDQGLFEGRGVELAKLKSAYQTWESGKHAPTVLVGEKWSGLTSLVNHFLDVLKPKLSVIRVDHHRSISNDTELMEVLSMYFKEKLDTVQEVIEHINALPAKKIVVVENLQFYYLKKVHGFQALQTLFKIIAETDQQAFWLVSCTEYGWQYLESTNAARDQFRHLILTEPIPNEQMVELIMKRNRISGYNVQYEVSPDLIRNRKFNRLGLEAKQEYLKKNFFTNLIKFSKSNVSLGLIFWLLSTKSISEDTITIGWFKEPDLSFLKQLSMPKVFILNNLILHDGLTINQLSQVMRMGTSTVQALVINLEDDGVLIAREDQYLVNPFVFRQIVNHLKLKNLIH
ncbi:MAG: helix-turn-helix domain-containing protein [Cyclobacteriaceae bacterium]